jgi:hypothetical protein
MPTRAQVVTDVADTVSFAPPIGRIGFDKNGDVLDPALTLLKVSADKVVTVDVIGVKCRCRIIDAVSAFSAEHDFRLLAR